MKLITILYFICSIYCFPFINLTSSGSPPTLLQCPGTNISCCPSTQNFPCISGEAPSNLTVNFNTSNYIGKNATLNFYFASTQNGIGGDFEVYLNGILFINQQNSQGSSDDCNFITYISNSFLISNVNISIQFVPIMGFEITIGKQCFGGIITGEQTQTFLTIDLNLLPTTTTTLNPITTTNIITTTTTKTIISTTSQIPTTTTTIITTTNELTTNPSFSSSPSTTFKNKITNSNNNDFISLIIYIGIPIIVVISLCILLIIIIIVKKRKNKKKKDIELSSSNTDISSEKTFYKPVSVETQTHYSNVSISPSSLSNIVDKEWLIKYDELKIGKELGSGAFGIVYKGEWRGNDVAIKNLTSAEPQEISNFLKEFELMKELRPHLNIVQVYGITSNPICIVVAFINGGSLLDLINSNEKINDILQYKIIKGITAGMMHLEAEKIVHRDLAARNVLLTSEKEPVISDFGMSRTLRQGQTSQKTRSDVGPLKWMAPESTARQEYSSKSDVWSWAITIWELLARQEPYPELDSVQSVLAVRDGVRLQCPIGTNLQLESLLNECWSISPLDRPSFTKIYLKLKSIYNDV